MQNQFVYSVFQETGTKEKPEIVEIKASFNINKVIRSMSIPGDKLVVILDDFHEELVTTPISVNPNTDRVIKNKTEKAILQSEIILEQSDKERFFKLTTI